MRAAAAGVLIPLAFEDNLPRRRAVPHARKPTPPTAVAVMEDLTPWLQLLNIPIGGFFLILLFTGKLVPWSWVLRYLDNREQAAVAINRLADVVEKLVDSEQVKEERDRTILHALESIQQAATRDKDPA